ncbi:hypothetical protein LZ32DRAFT_336409 [Colletotrichum eremochloae]|nr:hypothetical protein LZ32DRAFT_336409 [Colletotrichum eremochloae]
MRMRVPKPSPLFAMGFAAQRATKTSQGRCARLGVLGLSSGQKKKKTHGLTAKERKEEGFADPRDESRRRLRISPAVRRLSYETYIYLSLSDSVAVQSHAFLVTWAIGHTRGRCFSRTRGGQVKSEVQVTELAHAGWHRTRYEPAFPHLCLESKPFENLVNSS